MHRRRKATRVDLTTTNLTLRLADGELARIRRLARLERKTVTGFLRSRLTDEFPLDLGPVRNLIVAAGRRAVAGKLTAPEMDGLEMLAQMVATVRATQPATRRTA